ncbi:MAG TPA: hypothetical protein VMU54_24290, partial [Planctomycetota bacterium]|nr:hypothetical protein [Planctomycetota bacterium]
PKLKELRDRYQLDQVVAPGKDEFDRQVLLNDWVHRQFKKFGAPTAKPKGALEILRCVEEGHTFFCAHYADTLISAAASLGWVDRSLCLRMNQGAAKGGSTEHTVTEIWSNQYRKWVMFDPTANMHLVKDGIPLNAVEIRTEWFYHDGKDLTLVIGKERKTYHKADLPIFLGRFANFGDLTVAEDELGKYGFIGYVTNTNLMDARPGDGDIGFIVKDKLCEGTRWHERLYPANPAVDPYFPIGQAAVGLSVEDGRLQVALRTLTPNFKEFRVQVDGGGWKPVGDRFSWALKPGTNRLEARAINQFGVEGPLSTLVLESAK